MSSPFRQWYGLLFWTGTILVFLAVAFQVYRVVSRAGWWEANGTVIEAGTVVSVQFDPPGQRPVVLHATVEDGAQRFRVGMSVSVIYPGDDPHQGKIVEVGGEWFISFVFGGLGILCIAIACIWLVPALWGRYRLSLLQRYGQRVQARVTSVEAYPSLSVNGRVPWRIIAQWDDRIHNKLRLFRSESLWVNPEPYLKSGTVYVWVDPKRVERYRVDTSFLPERED
ncbi:MAG: DUF3592 domain-containing protein [Xanthomonadaceae bacterium]|nr:DUF3592 domain-containing protein [Xanthomonadaceae bacterium]